MQGVERPRMLVVQLTMRYLAEGFWPGDVQVGTGVAKVGRSSFAMRQGLFQQDRCLGLCETVVVHAEAGRSRPLPEAVRARLERHR